MELIIATVNSTSPKLQLTHKGFMNLWMVIDCINTPKGTHLQPAEDRQTQARVHILQMCVHVQILYMILISVFKISGKKMSYFFLHLCYTQGKKLIYIRDKDYNYD